METGVGAAKNSTFSTPNIVPLIDVLLVLIIIFMVITPLNSNGLPVLVPHPAPPRSSPEPLSTVVVQVTRDGKVAINHEPVEWSALGLRLADVFKQRSEKIAFVTANEQVPFAQVARAISIMRAAGIDDIGLINARAAYGGRSSE